MNKDSIKSLVNRSLDLLREMHYSDFALTGMRQLGGVASASTWRTMDMSSMTLPLEMSIFRFYQEGKSVELQWKLGSEAFVF